MTDVNLSEAFEAVVTVLEEVRPLMHDLAAREGAGEALPDQQLACRLAWPAIAAKWVLLCAARDQPDALSNCELAALLVLLHRDLVMLREVLAGRITLTDPETN